MLVFTDPNRSGFGTTGTSRPPLSIVAFTETLPAPPTTGVTSLILGENSKNVHFKENVVGQGHDSQQNSLCNNSVITQ